jgi:predicted metal-dependent hydrolase
MTNSKTPFPHWAHKNYPYGQFGVDHLAKMREGIDLFNRQLYWECHEALEEAWLEDKHDPARYVYWAVIQVAAILVHVQNQKIIGCEGMLIKARKKIQHLQEQRILTDLCEEFLSWSQLEQLLASIQLSNKTAAELQTLTTDLAKPWLDQYQALNQFKFLHYPFDYFQQD